MTLALRVNPRENRARLEVHDDALVEELVDDEDHAAHVVDEGLALDPLPEDAVKALVHAVEEEAEDQFVVVAVPDDEDCHVRVAAEDGDVVVNEHDVVLERVHIAARAATRTLLARLQEELPLKVLLRLRRLEWRPPRRVVVLGNDSVALIVEHDDALDVADGDEASYVL